MAPLTLNLARITSRFASVFTDISGRFTNILGLIACRFTTLFLIIFHVVIITCMRFFFEIPSFEELQGSNSSPGREEVGRRTLRDYEIGRASCRERV